MFSLAFYLVAALGLFNQVSSSPAACRQAPYDIFNFLSGVPAAEAFCTAHFPPLKCTKTVPSTHTVHSTTTTRLVVATATTTTSVVTMTSYTGTLTSTTFTETAVVTSVTGTDIITTTDSIATITSATSTSTTTVAGGTTTVTQTSDVYLPAALKARDTDNALGPREPRILAKAAPNPVSTLLSSLESKASAFISTVCSCIEATPACRTKTSVTIVTSTSTSTSSVTTTISVQGTTTVSLATTTTESDELTSTTDLATTTTLLVTASTTLDVVETSTVTSTSTVTEPGTRTYTRVYGPTSGYLYIDSYITSYMFGGDPSTINTQCGSICDTFSNCVAFFTDLNVGTKECYILSSAFSASKLLHVGSDISEDYAYNVVS